MVIGTIPTRLAPDASLAVFRSLLEAVSHPGRCVEIDLSVRFGDGVVDLPAVALGPLSLADIDVAFAVVGPDEDASAIGRLLERSTGARRTVDFGAADLVVACLGAASCDLLAIRVGSAAEPERGAKLFVACEALYPLGVDVGPGGEPRPVVGSSLESMEPASFPGLHVVVRGPGASAGRSFGVAGLDRTVMEFLSALNGSFPVGVDTWLVSHDGTIVAIPRSASIDLTRGGN